MNNFDEMARLWQKNKAVLNESKKLNSSAIVKKIKQTEKILRARNIFKMLAIILIFSSFVYYLLITNMFSGLIMIGTIILIIGTILFMIIYWRNQFSMKKLNFLLSEQDFIDDTIQKIEKQKIDFKQLFFFYILLLIVGINLIYFDIFQSHEFTFRILIHSSYSLFLFLLYFAGLRIREKVFNSKFNPLINELELIKNQSNNY